LRLRNRHHNRRIGVRIRRNNNAAILNALSFTHLLNALAYLAVAFFKLAINPAILSAQNDFCADRSEDHRRCAKHTTKPTNLNAPAATRGFVDYVDQFLVSI